MENKVYILSTFKEDQHYRKYIQKIIEKDVTYEQAVKTLINKCDTLLK